MSVGAKAYSLFFNNMQHQIAFKNELPVTANGRYQHYGNNMAMES